VSWRRIMESHIWLERAAKVTHKPTSLFYAIMNFAPSWLRPWNDQK
jgi:hypothetical protein